MSNKFWRFVFVEQQVEKLAMTAIEFPPRRTLGPSPQAVMLQ
jgi:hypothetical protein